MREAVSTTQVNYDTMLDYYEIRKRLATSLSSLNASSSLAYMIRKNPESSNRATNSEEKADSSEKIVAAQMQEMEMVRQKVYELERNQMQIKQRFAVTLMARMQI